MRVSFYIKLLFILIEFGLVVAFGVLGKKKDYNRAAIVEWTIALIFTFYVWSFAIDFIPAVRTAHYRSKETKIEMGEAMQEESRQRGYEGVAEEQNAYIDGSGRAPDRVGNVRAQPGEQSRII